MRFHRRMRGRPSHLKIESLPSSLGGSGHHIKGGLGRDLSVRWRIVGSLTFPSGSARFTATARRQDGALVALCGTKTAGPWGRLRRVHTICARSTSKLPSRCRASEQRSNSLVRLLACLAPSRSAYSAKSGFELAAKQLPSARCAFLCRQWAEHAKSPSLKHNCRSASLCSHALASKNTLPTRPGKPASRSLSSSGG